MNTQIWLPVTILEPANLYRPNIALKTRTLEMTIFASTLSLRIGDMEMHYFL